MCLHFPPLHWGKSTKLCIFIKAAGQNPQCAPFCSLDSTEFTLSRSIVVIFCRWHEFCTFLFTLGSGPWTDSSASRLVFNKYYYSEGLVIVIQGHAERANTALLFYFWFLLRLVSLYQSVLCSDKLVLFSCLVSPLKFVWASFTAPSNPRGLCSVRASLSVCVWNRGSEKAPQLLP